MKDLRTVYFQGFYELKVLKRTAQIINKKKENKKHCNIFFMTLLVQFS